MSEISAEAVANEYIVVFKHHTPEEVCQQHCEWAHSTHTEASALRAASDGPELTGVGEKFNIDTLSGYVASIDENLRGEVDYVVPNHVVYASANVTQKPVPSWGLARISSNKKLTTTDPKNLSYTYDASAGTGTWGYVVDTGVLITHKDFEGRAKWGFNAVPGSTNTDKAGHGTHVAGTIAGKSYGLAKKATIIAVKVLGDNGSGSTAGVIKGVEWAYNDAKNNKRLNKSVANLSLGGPKNDALNKAIAAAVNGGLTVVVAAGNDNKDASGYSPASEPRAFTIGSTDSNDVKSSYSNFGKSLDLFAPGRDITSAWIGSDTASKTISGTSMASPHVAGLALTLIAGNPGKYPTSDALTKHISGLATKNTKVTGAPLGTITLIGYNGV